MAIWNIGINICMRHAPNNRSSKLHCFNFALDVYMKSFNAFVGHFAGCSGIILISQMYTKVSFVCFLEKILLLKSMIFYGLSTNNKTYTCKQFCYFYSFTFICEHELMLCLRLLDQTGSAQWVDSLAPPTVWHKKMEVSHKVSYSSTQQADLPDFSPHFPFHFEQQSGKL